MGKKPNPRNLSVKRMVQDLMKKYENISVVAKKECINKEESKKTGK